MEAAVLAKFRIQEWKMIVEYVRIVGAEGTRMGTVKSARFDRGHVSFLFQQDPRLGGKCADVWLSSSDLEECSRPTDEQVLNINNLAQAHFQRIAHKR